MTGPFTSFRVTRVKKGNSGTAAGVTKARNDWILRRFSPQNDALSILPPTSN